jgi:hypothetical protein
VDEYYSLSPLRVLPTEYERYLKEHLEFYYFVVRLLLQDLKPSLRISREKNLNDYSSYKHQRYHILDIRGFVILR